MRIIRCYITWNRCGWSPEKQALILPTLLRGKLVECYVELEANTLKVVKEELMKRLKLCRSR